LILINSKAGIVPSTIFAFENENWLWEDEPNTLQLLVLPFKAIKIIFNGVKLNQTYVKFHPVSTLF